MVLSTNNKSAKSEESLMEVKIMTTVIKRSYIHEYGSSGQTGGSFFGKFIMGEL
jgi:hypothetical protein